MNEKFRLTFSWFLSLTTIQLTFASHLNGRQLIAASSGGSKPVPKFSLDTLKQAENIVLYDNAPLNTGKKQQRPYFL